MDDRRRTVAAFLRVRWRFVALALACLIAVTFASAGSATQTAVKQRIAIIQNGSVDTGGDFELIPMTAGPLKHARGGFTLAATVSQKQVLRDGLLVTPVVAVSTMTTKLGTFKLSQKIDGFDVSAGYSSDRGTWSFKAGTGVYAGFTGGGRFAAIGTPTGQELIRQEGFVRKG